MSIEVIGIRSGYTHKIEAEVRGDDYQEVLRHVTDWRNAQGWGYSPRFTTPVEIKGKWVSIISRTNRV